LVAIIPTRQSVLFVGKPGGGKSSLVYQAASQIYNGPTYISTVTGLPDHPWWVVIRATDRDPVDLRGIPYVKDGQTYWSVPDLIRLLRPEGGVICIEELPQAMPAVQCVLRELLLDHRIGGVKIPDKWTVVATGNRVEDNAGARKLLSHVESSVVKIELATSNEDWQAWALQAGVSPEVRRFLEMRPELLDQFNPARSENNDPRAWERVSILAQAVPEDLMLPVLAGVVMPGSASEFIGFRRIYKDLPDLKEIFQSPEAADVSTDTSVNYALTGALIEAARPKKGKLQELSNLITYADRLPEIFGILLMRDLLVVRPETLKLPEAKGWLKKEEIRGLVLGGVK
jgi:hypothetical protein